MVRTKNEGRAHMKTVFSLIFLLTLTAFAQIPVLEDGTPVKLRIARTVSSADSQVGEMVDFEVLEEVRVGDALLIPKGGIAWATVTDAQSKRRMGRGGRLAMNLDSVRLINGEKAALRAVKNAKGGGHAGVITAGIVGSAILFVPAAPFFLLIHGKDITVPKGTELTAYINGDMKPNLALKPSTIPVNTAPAEPPSASAQANWTEKYWPKQTPQPTAPAK